MQFHVLSFEGPDDHARAGGLASRVTGPGRPSSCGFFGDPGRAGGRPFDVVVYVVIDGAVDLSATFVINVDIFVKVATTAS